MDKECRCNILQTKWVSVRGQKSTGFVQSNETSRIVNVIYSKTILPTIYR